MISYGVPGSWSAEEICSKYESYWPDKLFASAQEMEAWLAQEGLQWRQYDEVAQYTLYQCDNTETLEGRLAEGREIVFLEAIQENNQMKSIYLGYNIDDKERITLLYTSDGQSSIMAYNKRTDQYINIYEEKVIIYYHFSKRDGEYIINGGRYLYK